MPFGLFDLISLLYLLRGAQALLQLFRGWRGFWDADLTPADRRLANQLAFFVYIPLGVFAHEAGHALATLQAGGLVADFQWRVFWGYVQPVGVFSLAQDWWIAFSGNLVSILLGLLPLGLLLLTRTGMWSVLLYASARQQLFYALVWYPALTLVGFGDWLTIYDFSRAPYAHLTAVGHAGLLLGLLALDRSPWVGRRRLMADAATWVRWRQLEAQAQLQPTAPEPLVNQALLAFGEGEAALAQHILKRAERLAPGSGSVKAAQASIAFARKHYHQAAQAAEAALQAGLPREDRAQVHRLLALAYLESGRRPEAVAHFDAALAFQPDDDQLYYWRAIVKRSLGRREEARADFEQARRWAPDDARRARAQQELEAMQ